MITDNDVTANELLDQLFIVNEADRPCEDLIAVLGDDGLLRYLHRDWPAMARMHNTTRLSVFGFEAVKIQGAQNEGKLLSLYQARPSEATYSGPLKRPRRWQGDNPCFTIPITKLMALITADESIDAGEGADD